LEAVKTQAKVAIVDYVYPSARGNVWDFGGSEINSGPTPSKLNEYTRFASYVFGTDTLSQVDEHSNYSEYAANINAVMRDFRIAAKLTLAQNNVKYLNAEASFVDAHSLELYEPKKSRFDKITGKNIIIAMDWRVSLPKECSGAAEEAITSDDLFSMSEAPESILVVGNSFHSIELAFFLASLGIKVTLTLKDEPIFDKLDRDLANKIRNSLENAGVNVLYSTYPSKIKNQQESAAKKVILEGPSESFELIVSQVLFATTNEFPFENLSFEAAGIAYDLEKKKVIVNDRNETNIPHIFAIGEIASNGHKAHLVNVQASRNLVLNISGSLEKPAEIISTFSLYTCPQFLGIGHTEQHAISAYGTVNIFYYNIRSEDETVLAVFKLITEGESERIVGIQACFAERYHDLKQQCVEFIHQGATRQDFEGAIEVSPIQDVEFSSLQVSH
jgi:thioredoxin reductase (NADPH)